MIPAISYPFINICSVNISRGNTSSSCTSCIFPFTSFLCFRLHASTRRGPHKSQKSHFSISPLTVDVTEIAQASCGRVISGNAQSTICSVGDDTVTLYLHVSNLQSGRWVSG